MGIDRGVADDDRPQTNDRGPAPVPDPTLRARIEDVRQAADGLLALHEEVSESFLASLEEVVRLAGFELDVQVHAPGQWPNFLVVDRLKDPGGDTVAAFVPDRRTRCEEWLVYVPLRRVAAVT